MPQLEDLAFEDRLEGGQRNRLPHDGLLDGDRLDGQDQTRCNERKQRQGEGEGPPTVDTKQKGFVHAANSESDVVADVRGGRTTSQVRVRKPS